jgi:aryl-alcohol dehydrogenase-like predicted oxidoreductase
MDSKKIILGSVQFGMDYGISNILGTTSLDETKKILDTANKNKVNFLDTAITYGESENIIGGFSNFNFNTITKLPKIPETYESEDLELWINNQIDKSLERLKIKKLYAVLLHCPEQLLDLRGVKIFNALQKLKKSKKVNKIGISVYSLKILEDIVSVYDLDIVQIPFNLIDQRLIKFDIFKILNYQNIELHVRSIFLQGLLLMKKKDLPNQFSKWSNIFNIWHKWLDKENITALEGCLSFVDSFSEINKIVIGVNNSKQLEQILSFIPKKNLQFPEINCDDAKLINPSNW